LIYHYMCLNLTTAFVREHSHTLRKSWECPECVSKLRRVNNDGTPVRSQGVMPPQDISIIDELPMSAYGDRSTVTEIANFSPEVIAIPLEIARPNDGTTSPPSQIECGKVTHRCQRTRKFSIDSSFLETTLPGGDTLILNNNETTNSLLLKEIRELRAQINLQAQKQEARDSNLSDTIKLMQLGIEKLNSRHTVLETELQVVRDLTTQNTNRINELELDNKRLRQELSGIRGAEALLEAQITSQQPQVCSGRCLNLSTQPETCNESYSSVLRNRKTLVSEPQNIQLQYQNHQIDNSRVLVLYGLDETRFETEAELHNRVVKAP
jgi:hypothetical protein